MADELGVASLRLEVDTSAAQQQLNAFRESVTRALGDLGKGPSLTLNVKTDAALSAIAQVKAALGSGLGSIGGGELFAGLEQQLSGVGQKAGRALRTSLSQATAGLNFSSIAEALDFAPQLSGNISQLQQYRNALISLRDGANAAAPGFVQLNEVIAELGGTIRNFNSSTASLQGAVSKTSLAPSTPELGDLRKFYASLERSGKGASTAGPEIAGAASGIKAVAAAVQQTNPALEELNRLFASIKGSTPTFNIKGLRQISDEAGTAGAQIQSYTKAVINGETPLANTTAALQQQARGFQTLAGYAKIGTSEFNNFTQAAAKASQKELFAGFDKLKALRQQFQIGRAEPKGPVNNDSFRGTEELLAYSRQVEKTPASINLYIKALEEAKAVTLTTDANFNRLTAEIERQRAALQEAAKTANAYFASLRQGRDALQNAAKPGPLALPSSEMLDAKGRGLRRLRPGEANDVGPVDRGLQAGREFVQQIEQRATAGAQAKAAVEAEAAAVARLRDGYAQTLREASQLLDVDLRRQKTINNVPRSREAAAQREQSRTSQLGAIQDRRRTEIRDTFEDDLQRVREARVKEETRALAAERTANAKREGNRKKRNDAISSGLIGGAFPLLFGQGIGASVGGAVGGAGGGLLGGQFGFGLSLVGTAVGAQFDQALQKAQLLGKAFDDPIANFSELERQALLSSKSLETLVKGLISTGRGAEAQAVIQADLLKTFGSQQGVSQYTSAVDALNRAWQQGTTILASFVAGPLAKLIDSLNKPGGNVGTAIKFEQLAQTLTPEQLAKVRKVTEDTTVQSARSRGGFNSIAPRGLVNPSENDLTAGRQAGIREAQKLLGVSQQQAKIAQDKTVAEDLYRKSLRSSYQIVTAQTQGYERQTLELQKQAEVQDRDQKLLELPAAKRSGGPEATKIIEDSNKRIYELNLQLTELDQKRWANSIASANKLQSIQQQIAIEAARPGLTGLGVGALQSVASFQEAQRNEQNAQAQLRTAPGDERLQAAARESSALVEQAAAKTKSDLIEAFEAAKRAVRDVGRSVEDASLKFNSLRGTNTGVNTLLINSGQGQAAADRASSVTPLLLKRFLSLREQVARAQPNDSIAEGIRNINVRGSGGFDFNQRLISAIDALQGELRSGQDLGDAQTNLVKANNDLAVVTKSLYEMNTTLATNVTTLSEAVTGLASKSWQVNVSVPGGSASGDVVGSVNSRL